MNQVEHGDPDFKDLEDGEENDLPINPKLIEKPDMNQYVLIEMIKKFGKISCKNGQSVDFESGNFFMPYSKAKDFIENGFAYLR